jgi:hypothetical protein
MGLFSRYAQTVFQRGDFLCASLSAILIGFKLNRDFNLFFFDKSKTNVSDLLLTALYNYGNIFHNSHVISIFSK